jgi:hypothetical protein
MKLATGSERLAAYRRKTILFCLLLAAFCSVNCSIPNLEKPECTEARQTVKEFYSYHFGNEMQFTPEHLEQRKRFLTLELINDLSGRTNGADPFTLTDDVPKAFRAGGCEVIEPNKRVEFGVLLFWKTDTRSEEREINVEAVRQDDKWLINKVSENNQK